MKQTRVILLILTAILMLLTSATAYDLPAATGWTSCEDTDGGNNPGVYGAIRLTSSSNSVVANDYCYRLSTGVQVQVNECYTDDCMLLEFACHDAGRMTSSSFSTTGTNTIWTPYVQPAKSLGFTGCKVGKGTTTPAPTCSDGIKNQDETGIDCGGACSACIVAPTPTCSDGIQNGEETGVDCGGICGICWQEPPTTSRANCRFFCDQHYQSGAQWNTEYHARCVAICNALPAETTTTTGTTPTCTDGIKNNGETDIDCGGDICRAACALGKACIRNQDCTSTYCESNACKTKSVVPISREIVAIREPIARDIPVSEGLRRVVEQGEERIVPGEGTTDEERVVPGEGVREETPAPADEAVLEEPQDQGFFGRAWGRIRSAFGGASSAEYAVESAQDVGTLSLDLNSEMCDKETISGQEACGMGEVLQNKINQVWNQLSTRIDAISRKINDFGPRIELLESVSLNRDNEMKQAARQELINFLSKCDSNEFAIDVDAEEIPDMADMRRWKTCKRYCESIHKICLYGVSYYTQDGMPEPSYRPISCSAPLEEFGSMGVDCNCCSFETV